MNDENPTNGALNVIELKLNGELSGIDAKTVADGLDLLRKLVGSFTPNGGPVKMASLRTGSTVTGVIATPEAEDSILYGIELVRNRQVLPVNWSSKQATLLRELARLSRRSGVASAEILGRNTERALPLDSALDASIQEAMKKAPTSIGSVVGKLHSYQDSAQGLSATLRDHITHQNVRVTFDEDLDAAIRQNLRRVVEVSGVLKRHPESNAPEEVDAKSVEAMPSIPTPVSGRGIWRRLKDKGVTARDIMHELRAEEPSTYGS
ncbi:hypothetical protein [Corynebacterium auris]|uniref:hypothetical protein n=1 Tax=Corynebacterium auris TaxID=44750 RepID=UPI0025B5F51B|nr:hypothetical protein [Corynebacterium auris]WJY68464.1 hypothetical protein CAURIS_07845 [Corynebacterium auris]